MSKDDSRIDPSFDFRSDAGKGDPDTTSPTLRRYHQLLWSKPLPGGSQLDLVTSRRGAYLYHESDLGKFYLSSDTVVPTFRSYSRAKPLIDQLPARELDAFQVLNHTIGAMMIFPGDRRAGTMTINGARGFSPQIADRFDLTVEAIRRHYSGQSSPLSRALTAYDDFFRVFESFGGYAEFFLLQDLLSDDGSVDLFTPFDDFGKASPIPDSIKSYRAYRDRAVEFIKKRNRRIAGWAKDNLSAA